MPRSALPLTATAAVASIHAMASGTLGRFEAFYTEDAVNRGRTP